MSSDRPMIPDPSRVETPPNSGQDAAPTVEQIQARLAKVTTTMDRVTIRSDSVENVDFLVHAYADIAWLLEDRARIEAELAEAASSIARLEAALGELEGIIVPARFYVGQIDGRGDAIRLLDEAKDVITRARAASLVSSAPSARAEREALGEPLCPHCKRPLEEVRYEGGYLNEDQFDSIRAGDWFCEMRPGFGKRYRYFWNKDLATSAQPKPEEHDNGR